MKRLTKKIMHELGWDVYCVYSDRFDKTIDEHLTNTVSNIEIIVQENIEKDVFDGVPYSKLKSLSVGYRVYDKTNGIVAERHHSRHIFPSLSKQKYNKVALELWDYLLSNRVHAVIQNRSNISSVSLWSS